MSGSFNADVVKVISPGNNFSSFPSNFNIVNDQLFFLARTDFFDPSNGSVSLDSKGDIFFTASKGFSGDASFTYTIADSNNAIDSAIVNLTIQ
ncbi:MAG: Ig-like domain-containing protein [Cyanobacteria bacterium P01_D01_bin.50]